MSRSDVPQVGQMAPDFETQTSLAEDVHLSEMVSPDHNTLLVFYRGHW